MISRPAALHSTWGGQGRRATSRARAARCSLAQHVSKVDHKVEEPPNWERGGVVVRERPRTRGSRAQELGRDAVQVGHLVVV